MTVSSTTCKPLFAGTACVVITPPVGIRMLGYTVQEACSQDRPLRGGHLGVGRILHHNSIKAESSAVGFVADRIDRIPQSE